jgi:hypothetical protein
MKEKTHSLHKKETADRINTASESPLKRRKTGLGTRRVHQRARRKTDKKGEALQLLDQAAADSAQPKFIRYDLTGPDGKTRKGWEM